MCDVTAASTAYVSPATSIKRIGSLAGLAVQKRWKVQFPFGFVAWARTIHPKDPGWVGTAAKALARQALQNAGQHLLTGSPEEPSRS